MTDSQKERELMNLFVHSNQQFYDRKWGSAQVASEVRKWNWPAFLFTPIWLSYRKMYGYSILYYVFALMMFVGEELWGFPSLLLTFPVGIYVGIQANQIYFNFVQKKVREIGDQPSKLMRTGGTSGGAAFLIFSIFVAIQMVILFGLFM